MGVPAALGVAVLAGEAGAAFLASTLATAGAGAAAAALAGAAAALLAFAASACFFSSLFGAFAVAAALASFDLDFLTSDFVTSLALESGATTTVPAFSVGLEVSQAYPTGLVGWELYLEISSYFLF